MYVKFFLSFFFFFLIKQSFAMEEVSWRPPTLIRIQSTGAGVGVAEGLGLGVGEEKGEQYEDSDLLPASIRALVLDGGGIRGIFSASALLEIRDKLSETIKLLPDGERDFSRLFQGGITATSTGSLIAMGLTSPRHTPIRRNEGGDPIEDELEDHPGWAAGPYTLEEIIGFYETMGSKIFECWSLGNARSNCEDCCRTLGASFSMCGESFRDEVEYSGGFLRGCSILLKSCLYGSCLCGCCACAKNCGGLCGPKYSSRPLREFLEGKFENITLDQAIVPIQIATFDLTTGVPVYFQSTYRDHRPEDGIHDARNLRVVDALLASSAAPTYFQAHEMRHLDHTYRYFVDGGVFDNSAVVAAIAYLRQLRPDADLGNVMLLSAGTGRTEALHSIPLVQRAGLYGWATRISDLSIGATADAHVKVAEKILIPRKEGGGVFAVQSKIPEIKLDSGSKEVLTLLKDKGKEAGTGREAQRFIDRCQGEEAL